MHSEKWDFSSPFYVCVQKVWKGLEFLIHKYEWIYVEHNFHYVLAFESVSSLSMRWFQRGLITFFVKLARVINPRW